MGLEGGFSVFWQTAFFCCFLLFFRYQPVYACFSILALTAWLFFDKAGQENLRFQRILTASILLSKSSSFTVTANCAFVA